MMRNIITHNTASLSFSLSLKRAVKNIYKYKGISISINKHTMIEKGYDTKEIWLRLLKKHDLINQPSGIKIQLERQTVQKIAIKNENSFIYVLYLKSFPDSWLWPHQTRISSSSAKYDEKVPSFVLLFALLSSLLAKLQASIAAPCLTDLKSMKNLCECVINTHADLYSFISISDFASSDRPHARSIEKQPRLLIGSDIFTPGSLGWNECKRVCEPGLAVQLPELDLFKSESTVLPKYRVRKAYLAGLHTHTQTNKHTDTHTHTHTCTIARAHAHAIAGNFTWQFALVFLEPGQRRVIIWIKPAGQFTDD